MEMDNGHYYPKPMNCPMHSMIYGSGSGRTASCPCGSSSSAPCTATSCQAPSTGCSDPGFTQDDAHIYCTEEQAPDEIRSLLDFVMSVLRAFGFEDFDASLSTSPVEKSVGTDESWADATEPLRGALEAEGIVYDVDEGGGAFYGPKIDVKVRRRSGGPGSSRPSSTTSTCPNGSVSNTSATTEPPAARSCSIAPCSVRSSGSSAC